MAKQSPQPSEVEPRRSPRETKSHWRANLKAQDLMDRFAALESVQVPEVAARLEADGASSTPRSWSTEKCRRSSTPGTSEPLLAYQQG